MDRQPLSSTNIKSVGYDSAQKVLEVEFSSGSVYQYFDVPEHIYLSLCSASSPGKFFQSSIRRAGYRFTQIT